MDPVSQLYAFQAVAASLDNYLLKNDEGNHEVKMSVEKRAQHITARNLCKSLATKLADHVYEIYRKDRAEDEKQEESKIEVISLAERRNDDAQESASTE